MASSSPPRSQSSDPPRSPPSDSDYPSTKRQKTSISSTTSPSPFNLTPASILSSFSPSLPPSLHLLDLPSAGRAVFTSTPLLPSTLLFRDSPLALLQFQKNQRWVLACAQCGRFIGSLSQQLHLLTRRAAGGDEALPGLDPTDQVLSDVIPCTNGCNARYCSDQCRAIAWYRHHELLCVGSSDPPPSRLSFDEKKARKRQRVQARKDGSFNSTAHQVSPLIAFTRHAHRHHQFFLLAAQVVATLVLHQRRGGDVEAVLSLLSDFAQRPWIETIDLDESFEDEPTTSLPSDTETTPELSQTGPPASPLYSDDGYDPDDEGHLHDCDAVDEREQHRQELKAHLQHVVVKSYHLLAYALFGRGEGTPDWMNVGWYEMLLGLFRLNNIAVELRSPLCEYFDRVEALQGPVKGEILHTLTPLVEEAMRVRGEEVEWERKMDQQVEDDLQDEDEDEGTDSEGRVGAEADDGDKEDSDEERSDSEDDESFRKEDEDSYPVKSYTWPTLTPHSPTPTPSSPHALTFSSSLFPSYHGSALLPTLSCINHACDANADLLFMEDARVGLMVKGEGGIGEGVEVCISYCEVDGLTREKRWKGLEGYGFQCACKRCLAEEVITTPATSTTPTAQPAMDTTTAQ